jgi:hypothetical protein
VFDLFTPASLGLALDVVGVIFLANSMGIRNPRRFLNEHFGVEPPQPLRAVHHQIRVKAQIFTGFLFLLFGFSLGIVGEVLGSVAAPAEVAAPVAVQGEAVRALLLMALLVIVLSLLLRLAQDAWSRGVFRRLLREFFQEHADWNFEKHPNTTREIGEIFGVARQEEDSIGDYAGRVRQYLGLEERSRRQEAATDDAFAPLRRLGADRRP